ncbi:MAG TPA: TetR/AcrR family transcriptional regulator [Opitutales bacterium]|nr:TetR/AcrR family transcriptional regulator [Opitutales bacterium]
MSLSDQRSERTSDRAEIQRNRILDAAEKCFIKDGFHVATMANISEEADMSTGLIYRYFENKNAIVLAIIERQLHERRTDISSLQNNTDLAGRILELLRSWKHGEDHVMNPTLFLEMSAEASRNPEIARALENADSLCRSDFRKWLKNLAKTKGFHPTDEDLDRRSLALQCLVEGLMLRTVREPEMSCLHLSESIQQILLQMLSFEEE